MKERYLPKERLREKRLDICLRDDEHMTIAEKAKQAGLPVATFVRHAALGLTVQATPSVNVDHWRQLARLAGNLNQVSHAINSGRATGIDAALLSRIGEQVRLLRLDLTGGAE